MDFYYETREVFRRVLAIEAHRSRIPPGFVNTQDILTNPCTGLSHRWCMPFPHAPSDATAQSQPSAGDLESRHDMNTPH